MQTLLTTISSILLALSSAQKDGMMCSFCMTIVANTQDAYGPAIENTTDLELLRYFQKECPRYAVKSTMLAGECEYLVSEHPLVFFRDLRTGKSPLDTCMDCGSC
ncbi:hypothetical protein Y032_0096g2934 [Ancylostoma ceylanicum]|uniref:Saposin B-type domain-containing protein n=1 Tax=Ancylostoma ceylanicum TaxID=53326 RepID=A0A016TJH1_9BILA|nr:hypothetical protein Y032_0096g2934 [Ancylostoma ceylanicum]